jgi:hypothetical protein
MAQQWCISAVLHSSSGAYHVCGSSSLVCNTNRWQSGAGHCASSSQLEAPAYAETAQHTKGNRQCKWVPISPRSCRCICRCTCTAVLAGAPRAVQVGVTGRRQPEQELQRLQYTCCSKVAVQEGRQAIVQVGSLTGASVCQNCRAYVAAVNSSSQSDRPSRHCRCSCSFHAALLPLLLTRLGACDCCC